MLRLLGATLLVASLGVSPALAQDTLTTATVHNSPADLGSWPVTATITSVTFTPTGFAVEFDRRLGANRWPDFKVPGWGSPDDPKDGLLQYTLGMCLNRGGWRCSSVVQYWNRRLEEEGPASSAAPDAIGREWFYDGRWGPLMGQQPAPGETVGLFVCAGDCRNRGEAWPGALKERSNVALVSWGSNSRPSAPPPSPPAPAPAPVPLPPDTSALEARLSLLEAALRVLTERLEGVSVTAAHADGATERIDTYLSERPIPTSCSASVFGLPGSCRLK